MRPAGQCESCSGASSSGGAAGLAGAVVGEAGAVGANGSDTGWEVAGGVVGTTDPGAGVAGTETLVESEGAGTSAGAGVAAIESEAARWVGVGGGFLAALLPPKTSAREILWLWPRSGVLTRA